VVVLVAAVVGMRVSLKICLINLLLPAFLPLFVSILKYSVSCFHKIRKSQSYART
jgi:hypothetical protein